MKFFFEVPVSYKKKSLLSKLHFRPRGKKIGLAKIAAFWAFRCDFGGHGRSGKIRPDARQKKGYAKNLGPIPQRAPPVWSQSCAS